MILTSGRRGYVKWLPNLPNAEARRTHMALHVRIKPENPNFGMYNIFPQYKENIVPLCQFQLE